MRNLFWCSLLAGCAALPALAQTTERTFENELRLDVVSLLAQGQLNLSYETFSDSPWSYGITAAVLVNSAKEDDFLEENHQHLAKWHAGPFVRYRLSEGRKTFYFVEASALYNSGDYRYIAEQTANGITTYRSSTDSYNDLALGGAVGVKVLFTESWGAEVAAGTGWNLLQGSESPDLVTRVGVRLVYRF